jgi:hypothetical protein
LSRHTTFTPEIQTRLVQLLGAGNCLSTALRAVGVRRDTFYSKNAPKYKRRRVEERREHEEDRQQHRQAKNAKINARNAKTKEANTTAKKKNTKLNGKVHERERQEEIETLQRRK